MAEERTLGLVRATEPNAEDLSKEELQRRMDETRESLSQTVTEIKENVQNQVQAVKDTLDWREQFRKRPVAWSAGAMGVGFAVGYCIAATVKTDRNGRDWIDAEKSYVAQPVLTSHEKVDEGPGFFKRLADTPAYEKVKDEAGNLGNAFMQEVSNIAKQLILPAVIGSLRNFVGGHLPASSNVTQKDSGSSTYEPSLERDPA